MKILALDPADLTGWAYSDGGAPPLYGLWNLKEGGRDRTQVLHDRIISIHTQHGCDLIAAEDAYMGSHNYDTAALHAELRGVIRHAAAEIGAEFRTVNPTTLKKFATGYGRAQKWQMVRACKTLLGIETDSDDIADALFILEYARQNPVEPPKRKRRRRSRKRDPQGRLF